MQTNLLWTGREYYSLENCLVKTTDTGSEINSIVIGRYDEKIYRVEYRIKTNKNWETMYVEVQSQHSNQREQLIFESDGKGNWMMDGKQTDQFNGCIDIDIPLTPFTNSLPINRLKLGQNEELQIKVIYLDLLNQKIVPVKQKYICLSKTEYHYENVPNDFEAKIEVDELGFVVDYPSLFVRTAKLKTDYR
jgi:hypothetical protein